jgi:hypothetical protein
MPFVDLDDKSAPRLQLEQLDAKSFCVIHGFIYKVPDRLNVKYTVPSGQRTDLGSVPFFLLWLVQSYGRHTFAVILHDYLWREKPNGICRVEANHLLRLALYELTVPFVRLWIMWTAVSLADLWMRKGWWRARLVAWVMAILGLDIIAGLVVTTGGRQLYAILAGIAGVAALVLILPRLPVIAIGLPALFLLIPSILVVLAMVAIYQVFEWLSYLAGQAWRWLTHIGKPVPVLNPPVIDERKLQRNESFNPPDPGKLDDPCAKEPIEERFRAPSA